MKKLVITILVTALILFGASFALRGVGEKKAQAEQIWLMQTLLPGSKDFALEPYTGTDEIIRSVYKAENGYVIETATQGYASEITMYVGVQSDGKVTGVNVFNAHETLGLGSRALTDHMFLSQFLNKNGSFAVASADAFSGATGTEESAGDTIDVDAITGATVTTKAVVRCVNSAVSYVTGADATSGATEWGG